MPQAYIKGYLRHYRSEGDPRKPCVMLSNSLGTDLSMWDAQAEALAQHFHVLRHDTRGLLDHLAIGKAHFWACRWAASRHSGWAYMHRIACASWCWPIRQAIVHAEVATVAASHLPNIEAEPAFARLLLAFLQA